MSITCFYFFYFPCLLVYQTTGLLQYFGELKTAKSKSHDIIDSGNVATNVRYKPERRIQVYDTAI